MAESIIYSRVGDVEIPMVAMVKFFGPEAPILRSNWTDQRRELPDELKRLLEEVLREKTVQTGRIPFNGEAVALESIQREGSYLTCEFAPTDYYSFLATHGSLQRLLPSGVTVREKYGNLVSMLSEDGYKFSRLAKKSGSSTVMLTLDPKNPSKREVILQRRSKGLTIAGGQMHVSVAEGTHPLDKINGEIHPLATMLRGIKEELLSSEAGTIPLPIALSHIELIALGLSYEYQQPEFVGIAKVPFTAQEIFVQASKARDKWERGTIIVEKFDPGSLIPLLKNNEWSPHASFALAMTLEAEGLL